MNRIVYHLKGVWILNYYVPNNPNKEKEPLLTLTKRHKLLPPKSEAQREWKRCVWVGIVVNMSKIGRSLGHSCPLTTNSVVTQGQYF